MCRSCHGLLVRRPISWRRDSHAVRRIDDAAWQQFEDGRSPAEVLG